MTVEVFDVIDSTYNEAGRRAPGFGDGDRLFLARTQTAGRGQGDHLFESPYGNGIYATLLVKHDFGPADSGFSSFVTSVAAVCITDAVDRLTGCSERLSVKPINDLMLDGKKYGGILCASEVEQGRTVSVRIGFGLNLGDAALPTVAVSLGLGKAGTEELNMLSDRLATEAAEMIAASLRDAAGDTVLNGIGFSSDETKERYGLLCSRYLELKTEK